MKALPIFLALLALAGVGLALGASGLHLLEAQNHMAGESLYLARIRERIDRASLRLQAGGLYLAESDPLSGPDKTRQAAGELRLAHESLFSALDMARYPPLRRDLEQAGDQLRQLEARLSGIEPGQGLELAGKELRRKNGELRGSLEGIARELRIQEDELFAELADSLLLHKRRFLMHLGMALGVMAMILAVLAAESSRKAGRGPDPDRRGADLGLP